MQHDWSLEKKYKIIQMVSFLVICVLGIVSVKADDTDTSGANRIIFFNTAKSYNSDCILMESDGHYGLIDTANRFANSITDSNGILYNASVSDHLSSQTAMEYGYSIADFMVKKLGITHLDFIIGTHAHSDHIGGIPGIALYTFPDSNGNVKGLINENTVFFYKHYEHVDDVNDDLGVTADSRAGHWSWHNQAYLSAAISELQNCGAVLIDVSETELLGQYKLLDYHQGKKNDTYDDYITFPFGSMSISLFNLAVITTSLDENVRSIVTRIQVNGHSVVCLGDINAEAQTEQKIAERIYREFGTSEILKLAHHNSSNGSNTRAAMDYYQPGYAVSTRCYSKTTGPVNENLSAFQMQMYTQSKYGTLFYETGASEYGLVLDLGRVEKITFQNLKIVDQNIYYDNADSCINYETPQKIGWAYWYKSFPVDKNDCDWMYYADSEDGIKPLTGKHTLDGEEYLFDEHGILISGDIARLSDK